LTLLVSSFNKTPPEGKISQMFPLNIHTCYPAMPKTHMNPKNRWFVDVIFGTGITKVVVVFGGKKSSPTSIIHHFGGM